jgi:hypothetical protein
MRDNPHAQRAGHRHREYVAQRFVRYRGECMESGVVKKMWFAMLMTGVAAGSHAQTAAAAASAVVYRCPGNPVLYTDAISAKEAKDKGCKVLEGAPITVIQSIKSRPVASPSPSPAGSRVDPADQRARDNDARRILEAELKREEDRLAAMKTEFNNGEPERQGNERNAVKYQERIADMKAAIGRKESDIASLKRELAKQPQ